MKEIELGQDSRALIFDLDGTLVDTMPLHYRSWQDTAARFSFSFPEERFYRLAGIPAEGILETLERENDRTLDRAAVLACKTELFLQHLPRTELIEPALNLVRRYHGVLPLAIGTGGKRDVVMRTLELHNLVRYFPVVITADDVSHHKPHPETFLLAAARLGVPPEKCTVIEDGDQGITAAGLAGMRVIDIRPLRWPKPAAEVR